MIFHEFNGCFTMMSYASIIFRESGSTLSPSVSSIIIGAIQLVGAYVASMLVDRLGRKVRKIAKITTAKKKNIYSILKFHKTINILFLFIFLLSFLWSFHLLLRVYAI